VQALLFDAGADDVWTSPIVMKKSRPAHMLSVLCGEVVAAQLREILFRETTSIGLREYPVRKHMLRREIRRVSTRFGEVDVKVAYFRGQVVSEKPEFEQCRALARAHGVSMDEIQKELIRKL
jgi:uncharacterized protein (DUF111 family)